MPFDGSNFDPQPPRPPKVGRAEKVLLIAFGAVALVLFALPVPFASLADIAHYLFPHR